MHIRERQTSLFPAESRINERIKVFLKLGAYFFITLLFSILLTIVLKRKMVVLFKYMMWYGWLYRGRAPSKTVTFFWFDVHCEGRTTSEDPKALWTVPLTLCNWTNKETFPPLVSSLRSTLGHIKFSGRMQITAIASARSCKVMTRLQNQPVCGGVGHGWLRTRSRLIMSSSLSTVETKA